MGESLPTGDFGDILKDGVVLCKLMNKLQPGSIKKFKEKVPKEFEHIFILIALLLCPGSSFHVDGECAELHCGCQVVWSSR